MIDNRQLKTGNHTVGGVRADLAVCYKSGKAR